MEDGNRMDLQDSEAPHCDFISVHEDIVNRVMQVMPADQQLLDLAEFFRVFGDSTRIRILYVLSQSEMCVCDIAGLLKMGQSAISHWCCMAVLVKMMNRCVRHPRSVFRKLMLPVNIRQRIHMN